MARSPVSPPQRPLVPDSPIGRIDRRALVSRHDPVLHRYDPENPLTVGNGEFAFTADVTGLQTFPQPLGVNSKCIPLCTQSQWGWRSTPNPENWSVEGYLAVHPEVKGYADYPNADPSISPDIDAPGTPEIEWLKENPHRLDLGRLALHWIKADGSAASPSDLTDVEQRLSLWDGELISRFQLEGEPVEVHTLVHPEQDAVAVRVVSPLLQQGRLGLSLAFSSGNPARFSDAAAWEHPEAHETLLVQPREGRAFFERNLDADYYYASARWSPGARLRETARHHFLLTPEGRSTELEWVCLFSQHPTPGDLPNFEETRAAARSHWNRFWSTGGAVDLSASRDPRWRELERRIVFSQYLTAIQCAGSLPPQESGLTGNSWSGKFHLEMHWWHAAHFALWDRIALLEKSLAYYRSILPWAREIARGQGYTGARWPKTPGPRGGEFPSHIAPYLLWQQPHPIYYAELCYRANPGKATLEKYREVVFETAEFMASFCKWDDDGQRFVLGPPMQCAQELYPRFETFNSLFELTYWRWGLQTARRWRDRLGLAPEPKWDGVLAELSRPVVSEGKYLFTENTPECYTNPRWTRDHPSVLGALGMLPGPGIDPAVMRRTFDWIWSHWTWEHTWGWDYPLAAMTAARLGAPEKAIDALLMETPKNRYALNGHVFQFGKLPLYLPANGGLLSAIAMMAAGWDGGPERSAPGFPNNGQWAVRWENLRPLP